MRKCVVRKKRVNSSSKYKLVHKLNWKTHVVKELWLFYFMEYFEYLQTYHIYLDLYVTVMLWLINMMPLLHFLSQEAVNSEVRPWSIVCSLRNWLVYLTQCVWPPSYTSHSVQVSLTSCRKRSNHATCSRQKWPRCRGYYVSQSAGWPKSSKWLSYPFINI